MFKTKETPEYKAKNGAIYKLKSTFSGVFLMKKQKNNKWISLSPYTSHGSRISRTLEHINPSWLSNNE